MRVCMYKYVYASVCIQLFYTWGAVCVVQAFHHTDKAFGNRRTATGPHYDGNGVCKQSLLQIDSLYFNHRTHYTVAHILIFTTRIYQGVK